MQRLVGPCRITRVVTDSRDRAAPRHHERRAPDRRRQGLLCTRVKCLLCTRVRRDRAAAQGRLPRTDHAGTAARCTRWSIGRTTKADWPVICRASRSGTDYAREALVAELASAFT